MKSLFIEQPLMLKTSQVLKLLQIGRSTLYGWIQKGKIHPLPNLHERNRMFSYAEIAALARIPVQK